MSRHTTRHHHRTSRPTAAHRFALAALALLSVAPAARAGVDQWTPLGPEGGSVVALAVDAGRADVVYAASSDTVFRSGDGGDSWSFAGAGLGVTSAPGIRTLATLGGAVLAGSTWDGIWRSLDDGRSWQPVNAGLPSRPHVEALVVDPRQRLWAATWEGLFVSSDRGGSWNARSGNLPLTGGVRALAVEPSTGQLYAKTVNDLFTSTDDGESWSLVQCFRHCGAVVIDPGQAGTLFTTSGGFLRSRDAGATWEKLRPLKKVFLTPLAFVGGRLFAIGRSNASNGTTLDRVYFSDDQGDHWSAAEQQPRDSSLSVLVEAGGTLWVGSPGRAGPGGVFRSRDDGNHWEAASAGLVARWIESLAIDPLRPGGLYAQASDHLFASTDDGASWRVSLPVLNLLVFGGGDLLADPVVAGRVWSTTARYLYRSDDAGGRWTQVRRVPFGVYALEADRRTLGGVWVGTSDGLYQSPNGRTWKRLRLSSAEQVAVMDVGADPLDPRVVWVAGYAHNGSGVDLGPRLYRTADGGASWQRRDDGLSGPAVSSVTLDPSRSGVVFAAAGEGVFRSPDSGASWQPLTMPASVPARWEVVAAPTTPATLYAHLDSWDDEAVYRSRDDGATWQRLGGGAGGAEMGAGGVRALVVDPHDPRRLLIGTAKRGIFGWTESP